MKFTVLLGGWWAGLDLPRLFGSSAHGVHRFTQNVTGQLLADDCSSATTWFGGLYGGKDQHGRATRGVVGGDVALPVGRPGEEGAHARRAVRDDRSASQASGARTPATRNGWTRLSRGTSRAHPRCGGPGDGAVGGVGSGVRQAAQVDDPDLLPASSNMADCSLAKRTVVVFWSSAPQPSIACSSM